MVHRSPGRVRLRVPARRGDRALFERIERSLGDVDGVRGVETNSKTGSVLIHYSGKLDALILRAAANGLGDMLDLALSVPPVALRVRGGVRSLDSAIRRITDGEMDLSTVASLALLAMAGVQLRRGQQPAVAVSLAWYASELLRRWQDDTAPRNGPGRG